MIVEGKPRLGAGEVRTFEQRYGDRCPFCNKSWGDPSPCGDSRADWTIDKSLSALFADRKGAKCSACDKDIAVGRKYCLDCGVSVERHRNRGDRHMKIADNCTLCGSIFFRRKAKNQRYCSISCSNKARAA